MKKPKIPLKYKDLSIKYGERFKDIISTVTSPMLNSHYVHWEELAHKYDDPELLTVEEYWYGLKIRRILINKKIPLLDKSGVEFSFILTDDIHKNLHKIDLDTAGNIESLFPTILNHDSKERYLISSLIEEAITSSQIEGAITTKKVAKEMLRSGRKPRDLSERMILNNYITMRKIVELKDEKLTPSLVKEIHKIITTDTLDDNDASGRLRRASEQIEVGDEISGETFHVPPDSSELESRLRTMCKFANEEGGPTFIHPVIRAIILHFWLAYEHPFVDGNGRTARALFYWSMLRNKYWLFEYISISQAIKDSKTKYYRSFLHTETDENDLTYFIIYHIDSINKSINSLGKYLEKKTKEVKQLEYEMKSLSMFNYRQKALLVHALKHPSHSYSFASHAASHNTARQTARTDIIELQTLGLLVSQNSEKRKTFTPANNLEEKIKKIS